MTDDLAVWLLDQIGADEALAQRNSDGNGLADGFPDYRTYDGPDLEAADEYISHFGPARMLAECDSKRRIVAEHSVVYVPPPGSPYPVNDSCPVCDQLPCLTLRLLALPFADRPGYRQEWAPCAST